MKPNILYGFYYNSMTEESSYALISLHRSRENAEKAMQEHKALALKEWEEQRNFVIEEYGARKFGMQAEITEELLSDEKAFEMIVESKIASALKKYKNVIG